MRVCGCRLLALAQSRGGAAEAEAALLQAVALGGEWGDVARYNLARTLLKAERWAEAAEAARGYLGAAGPAGAAAREARIALCHARLHLPGDTPPQEAATPPNPEGPLRIGGAVKRPEILHQVKPEWPPAARAAGTQGTVSLETFIDREGCVREIKVLQGLPDGVSEAASHSLRRWVFTPATLEGKPVDVYYVLTVSYRVG